MPVGSHGLAGSPVPSPRSVSSHSSGALARRRPSVRDGRLASTWGRGSFPMILALVLAGTGGGWFFPGDPRLLSSGPGGGWGGRPRRGARQSADPPRSGRASGAAHSVARRRHPARAARPRKKRGGPGAGGTG